MNTETDRSDERVWRFFHGELDEAGRSALKRDCAADPALRRRMEQAAGIDGMLRDLLPELEKGAPASGEEWAAQVQSAWEREQPRAERAEPFPARGVWVRRARPAAFGLAGLAAAAVLVLALYPAMWAGRGVAWSAPEFSPLALRGAEPPAGVRSVGADDARRCQAALRAAVEASAAERGIALPPGLAFTFRVQELRDGALSVVVQARARDGRKVGEWGGDYSGVDAFMGLARASGARIVDAVTGLPRGGASGGQP